MNAQSVITASEIKKAYHMGEQTLWALNGVDVEINEGEFVAVMGPSGSGKSTFMNMVSMLDQVSEGDIELEGRNVTKLTPDEIAKVRNKRIGFVFQQFNLLPRTSALTNVQLPLLYSEIPEEEWEERAHRCLTQVGLGDRTDHHPKQLSGGQQQRVAIARALVNDPVLIMADEPTGALDTRTGLEIMALFQDLNRAGKTIVLVTHEHEIAGFATRLISFRDGKIVNDEKITPSDAQAELDSLIDNANQSSVTEETAA